MTSLTNIFNFKLNCKVLKYLQAFYFIGYVQNSKCTENLSLEKSYSIKNALRLDYHMKSSSALNIKTFTYANTVT